MKASYNVTLKLRGPILTRSSSPDASGVDAPFHRSDDGKSLILPRTLIQGNLRASLRELATVDSKFDLGDLLGRPSEGDAKPSDEAVNPGSFDPRRSRIQISDFAHATGNSPQESPKRYRISIDPDRKAVKPMAYQVIESPFAPGQEVLFTGRIDIDARGQEKPEDIAKKLLAGMRFLTSVGAHKTSGFGRLLGADMAAASTTQVAAAPTTQATPALPDEDELLLTLTMLDPFCVPQNQPATNLFQSGVVIPGNVIKGAIATMAIADGKGAAFLDKVTIGHAFPAGTAAGGQRARVIPYSLVKSKDHLQDMRFQEGRTLVNGEAPEFSTDWKNGFTSKVKEAFGWPGLARDLKVRTAINEKGAAKDGQLFAVESVVPPSDVVWVAHVHCADTTTRKTLGEVAGDGTQVTPLSKTRARAIVGWEKRTIDVPSPIQHGGKNYYVITLQTDALLFPSEALDESTDTGRLGDLYTSAWNDLSGGSMALDHLYFARQKLAGGRYLHGRFRSATAYHPLILTEAGSVFALEVKDREKAAEKIKMWLRENLPLPATVEAAYLANGEPRFKALPYLPENGFGEIAVNMATPDLEKPAQKAEAGQ